MKERGLKRYEEYVTTGEIEKSVYTKSMYIVFVADLLLSTITDNILVWFCPSIMACMTFVFMSLYNLITNSLFYFENVMNASQ